MRIASLPILVIPCLLLAASAMAGTAYTNLGSPASYQCCYGFTVAGATAASGVGPVNDAEQFTSSVTGNVNQIDLGLTWAATPFANDPANVATISLWTSVSNLPGTELGSWGVSNQPVAGSTSTILTTIAVSGVPLTAGSAYFLVAEPGASNTEDAWMVNNQGFTGLLLQDVGTGWQSPPCFYFTPPPLGLPPFAYTRRWDRVANQLFFLWWLTPQLPALTNPPDPGRGGRRRPGPTRPVGQPGHLFAPLALDTNLSWNNLVDSTGASSSVRLSITGTVGPTDFTPWEPAPDPVRTAFLFWNSWQDGLGAYGAGESTNIGWTLTGLKPNATYAMFFYGALPDVNRYFNVTIGGNTQQVWSYSDYVAHPLTGTLFATVYSDASGSITGTGDGSGSGWAGSANEADWAGFQIVEVSPTTPEPSSLILLGSGVVGIAGTLRRKINS